MKKVHNRRFFLTMFLSMISVCAAAVDTEKRPEVSATIDFLDMAFQSTSPTGYYPLEDYEARIRTFAEAGITRLNLRTNIIGLTFYKSDYTLQYGERGAWHYGDKRAARLIETLKHYDPVAETIRLGHKYGMLVWCWENVTDEGGGPPYSEEGIPEKEKRDFQRTNGYPLMDPFFRTHPGCWATAKPFDFTKLAETNFRSQRLPIGKIIFEGYRADRPPIRFSREDIDLYYSYDNRHYQRYDKEFEFLPERTAEGRNRLILSGLSISAPYVKIAPRTEYDRSRLYTLALKGHYTAGEVYNIEGEKITSYWGYKTPAGGDSVRQPEGFQETTGLDFTSMPSIAVDHGQVQIGFFAGEFGGHNHLIGVVEFCDPVAMQHKLDKFSELARYPFDGYSLTLNCHSDGDNPDRFSYHPALRERLLDKTGKDIWRDELPLERIVEERALGFAEYAEGCKKLIGDRPLHIFGWRPGDREFSANYGRTNMGSLIWPYERLIRNGTVSGVVMYEDFSDYFTDEITGGRDIWLGIHRCVETGRRPKVLEATELAKIPGLDEIEYYGTVELGKPLLDMISAYTGAGAEK